MQSLRFDLPASVVVFLVALPLCLGIALASGAPLIAGLIAGIVGGIVVGALSGSQVGVAGPAAGLAVIGSSTHDLLVPQLDALVAVVLGGIIQVALGFLRAGIIGYYFPTSVIKGMLAGIGILIFLKQIPHALGNDKEPEGSTEFAHGHENSFTTLLGSFDDVSLGPVIITAAALVILIAWETGFVKGNKILSLIPGPLLAVTMGVLLGLGFASNPTLALSADQIVSIPVADSFEALKGFVTFPDFANRLTNPAVYRIAVVLAIVASLETLLCAEASDKLDPLKRVTPANRELKAQGVGNMVSGLIGGLPVTQVIVRSSANIQAGGKTKTSAIAHGFLLLIGVLALPTVLNLIPLATLAAILLLVGYKLARPALFKKMFDDGWGQFVPFLATIVGIVLTDLLIGIAIGLCVSIITLLYENFSYAFQMHDDEHPDTVRIVLSEQVSFLNKASVLNVLASIPDDNKVIIDATGSKFVHHDVVEIIEDFVAGAPPRNLNVTGLGITEHQKGRPSFGKRVDSEGRTAPPAAGRA